MKENVLLFTLLITSSLISKFESKNVISARTENFEADGSEVSNRLELTNNKYFNAGVTFINYDRWVKNNLTENLINGDITDSTSVGFLCNNY